MTPPSRAHRELDAGAIAVVLLLSALWGGNTVAIKIDVADSRAYRPSALAAFGLTTPLFGVLATAFGLGEPVGWRLAVSALLVAGGVAAATVLPAPAVAASAVAP